MTRHNGDGGWLFAAGHLIARRWKIVRPCGAGGMSHVYEAEDQQLFRRVAIKVAHPRYMSDAVALERLWDLMKLEARIGAQLHEGRAGHSGADHFVQIHAVDITDDAFQLPYMVMELLEGFTLDRRIEIARERKEPIRLAYGLRLGWELIKAVMLLHSASLVHCDIKPANLFLHKRRGVPIFMVTDLGLVFWVGSEAPGVFRGTFRTAAPEQHRGEAPRFSTDIFSCGVVLYNIFTLQYPFDEPSAPLDDRGLRHACLHLAPAPIQPLRADLPPELVDLIFRMLRKETRSGDPRRPNAPEAEFTLRTLLLRTGAMPDLADDVFLASGGGRGPHEQPLLRDSKSKAEREPFVRDGGAPLDGETVDRVVSLSNGSRLPSGDILVREISDSSAQPSSRRGGTGADTAEDHRGVVAIADPIAPTEEAKALKARTTIQGVAPPAPLIRAASDGQVILPPSGARARPPAGSSWQADDASESMAEMLKRRTTLRGMLTPPSPTVPDAAPSPLPASAAQDLPPASPVAEPATDAAPVGSFSGIRQSEPTPAAASSRPSTVERPRGKDTIWMESPFDAPAGHPVGGAMSARDTRLSPASARSDLLVEPRSAAGPADNSARSVSLSPLAASKTGASFEAPKNSARGGERAQPKSRLRARAIRASFAVGAVAASVAGLVVVLDRYALPGASAPLVSGASDAVTSSIRTAGPLTSMAPAVPAAPVASVPAAPTPASTNTSTGAIDAQAMRSAAFVTRRPASPVSTHGSRGVPDGGLRDCHGTAIDCVPWDSRAVSVAP